MEEKPLQIGRLPATRYTFRALNGALRSARPSGRRAHVTIAIGAISVLAVGVAGGMVAAGLLLLALVSLVVVVRHPVFLGPLVLLLLPAGEATHVLGAQVSALDAVVGGGAVGYLARLAARRQRPVFRSAHWAFALLIAFMALSTFGPVDDSRRIRDVFFWAALGVVFHAVTVNRGELALRLVLVALALATLVEGSFALFEYVDRWSDRFSLLHGAIVYPLPQGTLGHSNALAQFLVLATLGVVALSFGSGRTLHRLALATAAVGSVALVVTFSRASWIAFVLAACVYLVDRRTRPVVLVAGAVAAFCAALLTISNSGTIGARISSLFRGDAGDIYDFRFELAGKAARVVADHPLTGAGRFEVVGSYAGRPDLATHPHDLFLGLAVFFGIPVAVAFAALVFFALRASWTRYRRTAGPRGLIALGFVALLVGLLVNGLLEYPFWNETLTVLIVVSLAVAIGLDRADDG